ncbi:MAG: PAS domain S-box protein [Lentisphaerae bacterium]|nr:PAS domain S-box protein [Lentisphaerota bacterium]
MGRDIRTGNSGGFVFATLRGDVVSRASASWTTHLSYAVEEVENRSLKDFVHADDWPEVKRFFERRADTGEAQTEIWYRIRHKDGGWRHFVSTLVPSEQGIGKPATLLFVSRDVTEQKRLEDKIAQKQALLNTVPDVVPAIICARNREGRYLLVNKQGERFFGKPASSIIGKTTGEISINTEKVGEYLTYDREIFATGKPKYIPKEIFKNHAGEIRVFDVLMAPLVVNNEPAVLFMACENTDRHNMGQESREIRANPNRVGRLGRGGVLAMALAHEVTQPLTGILSNAQVAQLLLAQKEPDLTEIANIMADIVADNKRAGNVIKSFRTYLKREMPIREPIDVNGAILEIIDSLRSDSTLKGVTVSTELSANLPEIKADRVQIQQVVLNLVMNAEHAMAAQPPQQRQLTVKTVSDGVKAVIVSVRDTGHGIAQENLGRLFDAHFTTKAQGLGLGLTICRSIIEAHGGLIWAENNPDGGATFMFSLPGTGKNGPNVKGSASQQVALGGGGVP